MAEDGCGKGLIPEEREGEVKTLTGGSGYVCEETPRATAEEGKSKVYLCRYSSRKTFSWGIIKTTQVVTQREKRPHGKKKVMEVSPHTITNNILKRLLEWSIDFCSDETLGLSN